MCKAVKQANYNLTTPMGKIRACTEPWQMIAVDFLGPLPRSSSGNRWILTIVDCFTKYAIIHPCRDATAAVLNKIIEERVILVHGAPQIIIADNGSQFKSKGFRQLVGSYQIALWYAPHYYAQANPSETVNKIIGNCIRAYIKDDCEHKTWDRNIVAIAAAINSSVHTTTKSSPLEALFGRKYIISGRKGALSEHEKVNCIVNMKKIQTKILEKLKEGYEKSKERYDLRARQ